MRLVLQEPVSIAIDTFGTGEVSEGQLVEAVKKHFDLRPAGIIKMLDLKQPIYKQTAAYGHFGRTRYYSHGKNEPKWKNKKTQ